jgi:CubicO group peptidase (beta-lactamase class C family)
VQSVSQAITASGVLGANGTEISGDGDARFEIGSVTKVFTGVLLAEAHLRGEVSLEDPLSRHLPGPGLRWREREPTLLELATHRSGLPNAPAPLGRREFWFALGIGKQDPWAGVTAADYARYVAAAAAKARPGRFRYSSLAYGLLGDALAAARGRPYETLARERILEPLGMAATSLAATGLVEGHSRRGGTRPPLEDVMPAAGSLRSSVSDMLRFLERCCLDPTPAMALAQSPHFRVRKRMAIGLGWMILSHPDKPQMLFHNGGTWGFRSFAGLVPERRRAVVVLSSRARSVDRFAFELLENR